MKHVNPVSEPERGGSDVAVCQETLGKMSKLSIIPTCDTKECVLKVDVYCKLFMAVSMVLVVFVTAGKVTVFVTSVLFIDT